MRSVLGHFCSGVTVVTAMGRAGPVGFTCQAFTSLSLRPPQVLLCPSLTSTTWPVISECGRFCVNVLAQSQSLLSERFAQSGGDKFHGVRWTASPHGSPRLTGALAWLDCEVHAEYDGGDHLIVRGDIRSLEAASAARPLLYYRGCYAGLAEEAFGAS